MSSSELTFWAALYELRAREAEERAKKAKSQRRPRRRGG